MKSPRGKPRGDGYASVAAVVRRRADVCIRRSERGLTSAATRRLRGGYASVAAVVRRR